MTPQEIIREIQKLPPQDQQEIKDSIEPSTINGSVPLTEEEFIRLMYAKGIIGNVPNLSIADDEDDWEPIEIKGKPTSEIIIEDRG